MELGQTYARRLDEWVAALRADTALPDLPVYVVQIGRVVEPPDRQGMWPGWDLVREAQRTLPERPPHTAVTSAVDLTHADTPSLIRLGRRMAKLTLAGRQLGPQVADIERFKPAGGCVTPSACASAA